MGQNFRSARSSALFSTLFFVGLFGLGGLLLPPNNAKAQDAYTPELALIGVTDSFHNDLKGQIGSTPVKIGIFDGIMRESHQEFQGKDVFLVGSETGLYLTYSDHGTHVAGIAAAGRNGYGTVGVNPWADIINIGMFDSYGWVGISDYDALNYSRTAGVRVVNMSYGPTTRGLMAFEDSVRDWAAFPDIVISKSAGNDGTDLVPIYYKPADGSTAEQDLAHVLIVGSVTDNGLPSSFSNTPGENCFYSKTKRNRPVCSNEGDKFKYFFIMAPGSGINAPLAASDTAYGSYSGTSMAAPHVTGAASLLLEVWPHLSAVDVVSILKDSATEAGAEGVDSVYGWGILNVAAAMQPLYKDGFTIVIEAPTDSGGGGGGGGKDKTNPGNGGGGGGGGGRPFAAMSLGSHSTGGRVGFDGLEKALEGFTAFDDYNRDFDGRYLAEELNSKVAGFSYLREFFGFIGSTAKMLRIHDTTPKQPYASLTGGKLMPAKRGLWFGDMASFGSPDLLANDRSELSFFAANKRHLTSSILQGGTYAGMFFQMSPTMMLSTRVARLQEYQDVYREGVAADVELQIRTSERIALSFGVSYIEEDGSTLGAAGSGAFELGEGTRTFGFEHHISAKLSEKWFLDVAALVSRTETDRSRGPSLFSDVDSLWSMGGSIQATRYGVFSDSDALSLAVSLPLQTFSGSATISGGFFDRSTRTLEIRDQKVSLATDRYWSTSIVHGMPVMDGRASFGYGLYAQFEGGAFDEAGLGLNFALKL